MFVIAQPDVFCVVLIIDMARQDAKGLIVSFLNTKVTFTDPAGYVKMLSLLNNCEMIISDSGGLQKESYFAKKKCIVVRPQTEWKELIDIGTNILCEPENIFKKYQEFLNKKCNFSKNLYGDGNASSIIVNSINSFFS